MGKLYLFYCYGARSTDYSTEDFSPEDFSPDDYLPAGLFTGGNFTRGLKRKDNPYSNTERRVPELIPVLGSQPAGDVSHKPGGRLPSLSARAAVTPATLKRAATSFAAW